MANPRQGWRTSVQLQRMPDDLYPTPEEATECLIQQIKFSGAIWECASGFGHISKVFEQVGFEVISTDLRSAEYEYGEAQDFLTATETKAPNIVTNPPYALLRQFLPKALTLPGVESVTFFLPLPTLSKVYMQQFFLEYGAPSLILSMVPLFKIYMGEERGTQLSLFTHCWVYWDLRGLKGGKRSSSEFKLINWRKPK